MRLLTRFRNLSAIPSYHYHPVFGREVVRTIKTLKPAAIALEISEMWASEFEWGVSLWPSPVVSYANDFFLPVVPGDSMVEACRLAKEFCIPLFFVDFALADIIMRASRGPLPDAALAPRVGSLFLEASDALQASAGPPATGDMAREAHMAVRLAELMERFDTVLWVGGMAHWSRIRDRLTARAFDDPQLREAEHPVSFRRMRLEWSALYDMTQRLPFQLVGYSRAPISYDEARRLRQLALAAVKPEKHEPVDVAAMLVYARNIEALEDLSESPGLWQLLTAASSCLGNEYASRLATLALTDRFNREAAAFPLLSRCVEQDGDGKYVSVYRCEGQILAGKPLFRPPDWSFTYRRLPSLIEINRRGRNTPAADVKPAAPNDKKAWASYPDDDIAYEAFVRYVLEHLSASQPDDMTSLRFVSGMGEGIDVRETIRHLHEGGIYVRDPQGTTARARNGLIDYTSHHEDSWILQEAAFGPSDAAPYKNAEKGGWIDPSLQNVGSASWTVREPMVVQNEPFRVQRSYRELSLITLDAPTWLKADDSRSLYGKVIKRLLKLPPRENNLYGWLRTMFTFCRNKPFAYYSHYQPGPRVHAIAREFGVRIIYVPLARIPQRLLERHQSFQFMNLTRAQWEELLERISESKRAWVPSTLENDVAV
jgi:hypothetical protein